MAEWWSIEVLHGEFSAFRWQEQHDSVLIEVHAGNGMGPDHGIPATAGERLRG
jgi:hypothetical protein